MADCYAIYSENIMIFDLLRSFTLLGSFLPIFLLVLKGISIDLSGSPKIEKRYWKSHFLHGRDSASFHSENPMLLYSFEVIFTFLLQN